MNKQPQNDSTTNIPLPLNPDTTARLDAAIAKAIRDAPAKVEREMALPPICEPGEGIYYDPNWKDCVADGLESMPGPDAGKE